MVAAPVVRRPDRPLIVPRTAPVVAARAEADVGRADRSRGRSSRRGGVPGRRRGGLAARTGPGGRSRGVDGPSVTVRRVPVAADSSDVPSLREALDNNGGVVEIADDGPFFEDDLLGPRQGPADPGPAGIPAHDRRRTIDHRPRPRPLVRLRPRWRPARPGGDRPRHRRPGAAAVAHEPLLTSRGRS